MVLNGEEGLEFEVWVDGMRLGNVSELSTWDVFRIRQMRQSEVGRWGMGGGMQVLLGLWLMLGISRLSVLGSCIRLGLCLFLCMVTVCIHIALQCILSLWGGGGPCVQLLGSQGSHAPVIFVLCEYIWNAPLVSLFLPTFYDTGSLGSSPCRVIYLLSFTLGDCLPFPCRE